MFQRDLIEQPGRHLADSISEGAINSITTGVGSSLNEGVMAGEHLAEAIIAGFTSALGASGGAISRVAGEFGRTLSDAVSGAFGAVGSVVTTAGKALTASLGLVTTAAGALIGSLVGAGGIGAAIGAGVALVAGQVISAISESFTGLVGAIGKSIGAVGRLATSAFEGLTSIFKDLANTASAFGRSVMEIRAATGFGSGLAGQLAGRASLLGMNTDSFTRRDPMISAMYSRLFNLPDVTNREFMPEAASRFQSGMAGGFAERSMAQMMARMMGLNTSTLMMNPNSIRGQMDFQDRAGGGGDIARQAEEMMLAQQRVGFAIERIKLSFFEMASPALTNGLLNVAETIVANTPRITEAFSTGFTWLFVEFPALAINAGKFIIDGAMGAVEGLMSFASGISGFLRALEEGNSGLGDHLGGFLQFVDSFTNGFKSFMVGLTFISQGIYNLVSWMSDISTAIPRLLTDALKGLGAGLLSRLGLGDLANTVSQFSIQSLDQLTGLSKRDPFEMARAAANMPQSNLYGAWQGFRQSGRMGDAADRIDEMSGRFGGSALSKLQEAKNWLDAQGKNLSPENQRALLEELQKANNHLGSISQTNAAMAQTEQRRGERSVAQALEQVGAGIGLRAVTALVSGG